eukprot:GHVT01088061.1.p1 GENE.GHVT01088061.1~~GHVT01088061.1.p1  ORF type:complete len:571 (+),score=29.19 GHVT01088061.1:278-1990(+)
MRVVNQSFTFHFHSRGRMQWGIASLAPAILAGSQLCRRCLLAVYNYAQLKTSKCSLSVKMGIYFHLATIIVGIVLLPQFAESKGKESLDLLGGDSDSPVAGGASDAGQTLLSASGGFSFERPSELLTSREPVRPSARPALGTAPGTTASQVRDSPRLRDDSTLQAPSTRTRQDQAASLLGSVKDNEIKPLDTIQREKESMTSYGNPYTTNILNGRQTTREGYVPVKDQSGHKSVHGTLPVGEVGENVTNYDGVKLHHLAQKGNQPTENVIVSSGTIPAPVVPYGQYSGTILNPFYRGEFAKPASRAALLEIPASMTTAAAGGQLPSHSPHDQRPTSQESADENAADDEVDDVGDGEDVEDGGEEDDMIEHDIPLAPIDEVARNTTLSEQQIRDHPRFRKVACAYGLHRVMTIALRKGFDIALHLGLHHGGKVDFNPLIWASMVPPAAYPYPRPEHMQPGDEFFDVVAKRVLSVGVVRTAYGNDVANYLVDTPVGFVPRMLRYAVADVAAQYSALLNDTHPDISVTYRRYDTSHEVMLALARGTIHMADPTSLQAGYLSVGQTGRTVLTRS